MGTEMRLLLDTSILLDYFGKQSTFYMDAVKLRIAASYRDVELWGTANSLSDVYYLLQKDHGSKAVQDLFLANREVLNICSVTSEDIFDSAEEKWSDFENCLLHTCAKKIRADYIITLDLDGFIRSTIPCVSPSEFFNDLEEKRGICYSKVISELEQELYG